MKLNFWDRALFFVCVATECVGLSMYAEQKLKNHNNSTMVYHGKTIDASGMELHSFTVTAKRIK